MYEFIFVAISLTLGAILGYHLRTVNDQIKLLWRAWEIKISPEPEKPEPDSKLIEPDIVEDTKRELDDQQRKLNP